MAIDRMDLRLFRLRNLWIVTLVFLLTLGAASLYVIRLPETYSAESIVQISPRKTANGGVVGNETVSSAAAGYAAYLGAPATIDAVSAAIGIPAEDIERGLKVKVLPATTTLTVEYVALRPEDAPLTANAMAAAVASRAANDQIASAVVLSKAATPRMASGPPRRLLMFAGLLLAFILAGMTAAVVWRFSRPRDSAADDPTDGPRDTSEVPDAALDPR